MTTTITPVNAEKRDAGGAPPPSVSTTVEKGASNDG